MKVKELTHGWCFYLWLGCWHDIEVKIYLLIRKPEWNIGDSLQLLDEILLKIRLHNMKLQIHLDCRYLAKSTTIWIDWLLDDTFRISHKSRGLIVAPYWKYQRFGFDDFISKSLICMTIHRSFLLVSNQFASPISYFQATCQKSRSDPVSRVILPPIENSERDIIVII